MTSFFLPVPQLPEDPIFGLQAEFNSDPRSQKINLSIGAYQNSEGKPQVFDVVRKAEQLILNQNLNKEYLGIEGQKDYIKMTLELILGKTTEDFFAVQTIGGTSALRLGAELLSKHITKSIFISNPTWANHQNIFSQAGMAIEQYPYYDLQGHRLDFEGMAAKIKLMPRGSAVLLHGCCHNPSGIDPTVEQWKVLSKLILEQHLFPFFDFAYQGFGVGVEADAFPIRQFREDGHEMLVAYSYSKNFGLYGERAGLLAVITNEKQATERAASVIKNVIRSMYSNPPLHGARIISTVLKNPDLRAEWLTELETIRKRIQDTRETFYQGLDGKFQFIQHQRGMFSFSGLNVDQVERLKKEYGIYLVKSGRINIAGLNEKNIGSVIDAILNVIK